MRPDSILETCPWTATRKILQAIVLLTSSTLGTNTNCKQLTAQHAHVGNHVGFAYFLAFWGSILPSEQDFVSYHGKQWP